MIKKVTCILSVLLLLPCERAAAQTAKAANNVGYTGAEAGLLVYTGLFFPFFGLLYFVLNRKKLQLRPDTERWILFSVLGLGFLVRACLAPRFEGFSVDVNCFRAWAAAAAKDLPNFYNTGMFCDYPPFYIYVLFLIGKITALPGMGGFALFLVKLPSILADIATACLLYKIAKKHQFPGAGLPIAAFYVLNPAVLINSTLWGQVDSFFTLMILTALILLAYDRLAFSSVIFAAAILMKPQGLIFLPVLFYELVKRRKLNNFLVSGAAGLAASAVIILPFSRDPFFIFRLFTKTASGYTYASLNAFNLFALFGVNLRQDSEKWLQISFNTWGNLLALSVVVFTLVLYLRSRNSNSIWIAALLQITGIFMLWSRMHERYLFPAAALSLAAFLFSKDKRLLLLGAGFSATIFLNTHVVLFRMVKLNYPHVPADDPVLFWVSLANVLLLAYLVKVSVDLLVSNKACLIELGRTVHAHKQKVN